MKTRIDYLLDFDGTMTSATGEDAFDLMRDDMEVFADTTAVKSLNGNCTLKNVDELVQEITKVATPDPSYKTMWDEKFLVTKEALEFLIKMTSHTNDASPTNIVIVSRNHKNYILAMLKYSLSHHFKNDPSKNIDKIMQVFTDKIEIHDRKDIKHASGDNPVSKAHAVISYLEKSKDSSTNQKIYIVDDSDRDFNHMVTAAEYFKAQPSNAQRQIEVIGAFKTNAQSQFPWDAAEKCEYPIGQTVKTPLPFEVFFGKTEIAAPGKAEVVEEAQPDPEQLRAKAKTDITNFFEEKIFSGIPIAKKIKEEIITIMLAENMPLMGMANRITLYFNGQLQADQTLALILPRLAENFQRYNNQFGVTPSYDKNDPILHQFYTHIKNDTLNLTLQNKLNGFTVGIKNIKGVQELAINMVSNRQQLLKKQLEKLTKIIGLIEKEETLKPKTTMTKKAHQDKYQAKQKFVEGVLAPAKMVYYSDDPKIMPATYKKYQDHINEVVTADNFEKINQKIETDLEVINKEIKILQTGLTDIAEESRKVQKIGTSKTEIAVQRILDVIDDKATKKSSNPFMGLFSRKKSDHGTPEEAEKTENKKPPSPKPGKRSS